MLLFFYLIFTSHSDWWHVRFPSPFNLTRPSHKPMWGHVSAHQRCRHQFKLVSKAERSSRGGRAEAARERTAETLNHGLFVFRMSTTHWFAKMWTGLGKLLLLHVTLAGFLLANGKRQCSTLSVRLCKCSEAMMLEKHRRGHAKSLPMTRHYEQYNIQKHYTRKSKANLVCVPPVNLLNT